MHSLFSLENKVALVTGASKGIGIAMATGLAECGAKVIISSRDQASLDEQSADLRAKGLSVTGIAANMGNATAIHNLMEETLRTHDGLDILINNAAANPVFGPIDETDDRAFNKIIDVNLKGPFELCKAAYPIMKRRGGGSIINLGSIGGITPEKNIGIYSVSKAAINNMTKAMAQDWGPDNIRVNSICPGLIKTRFSEALWKDEDTLNRFLKRIPLGRAGDPMDIAGLAVFLASDASAYCTGGIFMADGGYSAA